MSKDSPDTQQAERLKVYPVEIAQARETINQSLLVRRVLQDRMQQQIEELRNKLESVKPEDLAKVQGQISGLKLGMAVIDQK